MMNRCNAELFPIFDAMADNYIARCRLEKDTAEYEALDRKSLSLYGEAFTIFKQYNGTKGANAENA